jgi:hypothetical protein
MWGNILGTLLQLFILAAPTVSKMNKRKRKRKRKRQPEGDEATISNALADTLRNLPLDLPSERRNDVATALKYLETGPQLRVSARTQKIDVY